ncbi:MAG: hypothetical protein ACYSW7_12270, partial [Planctomycetota bacterium]
MGRKVLMVFCQQEDGDDMPYEVVEGHEECEELFAVVKIDGQEVMGCHSTVEEAEAQVTALNIAEADEAEAETSRDEDKEEVEEEKQFDDSEWDGAASNWPDTAAYCSDSLIDVNPAGEDKVQALCFLPFRKHGSERPNLGALRTMATGRGLPAIKKPDEVSSEEWNSKVRAAARRLVDWWPEAFDKEPPEAIANAAKEMHEEDKAGRRIRRTWKKKLQDAYD